LIPHEGEEKDTTKRTIKINVRRPHQMGPMLSDQKEGGKQCAFSIEKRKGCASIDVIKEGLNGRHSKDIRPKFKLKLLRGRGGKRRPKKRKKLGESLRTYKPNNAFDAKP